MEYERIHEWTLDPEKAKKIQLELRKRLVFKPFEGKLEYVAGVDLSFPSPDEGLAVVVILRYPTMDLVDYVYTRERIDFPYIPGLLVFREGPAFLKAWEKLKIKPDLVVFDGQGIAHPRGIGIASHMGLFIGIPTIGVAKSRLYGWYDPLPDREWARSVLKDRSGNPIGYVVRTKRGVNPVFVSPGHLIDLESSYRLVKEMTLEGKRIPEPTRMAHNLTQRLKRSFL